MNYKDRFLSVFDAVEFSITAGSNAFHYAAGVTAIRTQLSEARERGRTIYFVGNGGSAGIAVHMAADFQKNGEMKTQTFFDPALLTCMANDYGYENALSKPLERHAQAGDILIAISSSGASPNIMNAVKAARKCRCTVITFSGFCEDNPLRQAGDINVYVPSFEYGIVESIHNIILQQVVDEIKTEAQKEP